LELQNNEVKTMANLTKRFGIWALVTGSKSGIEEAFSQKLAE